MTYRNDVFGFDHDRPAEPEGPGAASREASRTRRHETDEELGWSSHGPAPTWSREQWIREHGGREHGGFSNYAGGGDRDRFAREREVRIHAGPPAPHAERWHRIGQRDDGWYAGTTGRLETESWYAAAEPLARGAYGPRPYGHVHGLGGPPRCMTARELDLREREWIPPYERFAIAEGLHGEPFELERGPWYGKGPKGFKRSDERIREDVCETIARQGWIDATDVEVSVEHGVVRLSGTVCRGRDRRALEALVERVLGVEEVKNELRLRRDETSPTLGVERQAPGRDLPDDPRSARH